MRALALPLSLGLFLTASTAPLMAQPTRFIKVDVVSKSGRMHGHQGNAGKTNGPTEVKMRVPISLAKGVLEMAGDTEVKVNGETKKGLKPDALIKLLEGAKPGDLLLEITTNDGDHVRITVE